MAGRLPIHDVLPQIRTGLRAHRSLVLQAPPGAGKTTVVPLALLEEPWLAGRTLLMLEPRRLAARSAAAHMARQLGEEVGATVGYRVRFDTRVGGATRVEVLTEGILTRRLQADPALEGVGLVIFDEFHERSLHADLALALCREVQQSLREDLRLLVMSATLDGEALAGMLAPAAVVVSEGRRHPVATHHLAPPAGAPIAAAVTRCVCTALEHHPGDILAFLPGGGEIRRTRALLEAATEVSVLTLHGDMALDAQQRAIEPDPAGRRRVVLATPIAETSLTIEGISVVVDSGWARRPRFDPRSGLTRLETVRITRDSAEQRAGRAGRLGPGTAYRLWSESTHRTLAPHRPPEILEADLAPLALELALWGVEDPGSLSWLDPPPAGALAQARALLTELDALDGTAITRRGRDLAGLALHPRLAHMILEGQRLGHGARACDLAALLEERDLLQGPAARSCDVGLRLEVLDVFRRRGREAARALGADPVRCATVARAAGRWRRQLRVPDPGMAPEEGRAAGTLLALAYPDRVARRREGTASRFLLSGGRGATLADDDPLVGRDWLVAAHLDAGRQEGRIFLAANLELGDVERTVPHRLGTRETVAWDAREARVVARRERRLGALVLETRELPDSDPERLVDAMLEGIRAMGLACLPWKPALRQWQTRVLCMAGWFPEEEGWPEVSDAHLERTLETWLGPHLGGMTRRAHLQRLDLGAALATLLPWPLPARLDEGAPTHLTVPSGSRLRLNYSPGEAPVLAVKLQEMFGLGETPRVAGGRVPVTLHLLSPAGRPVQVTRDLRGFWDRTYPEVAKELRGRYPKHPWPEDPWNATPTRRTRARRS